MQKNILQNIQLLPEHIIDQIKAGEVIERPSTLIKEILENAVDAGATKIDIHIVDNGLELISIKDNGCGIDAKDLGLAFCRHATSKIERFEDVYALYSYGFRGEALASIASISKVSCQSITKNTQGRIIIEGGLTLSENIESAGSEKTGTQLYIKELFYNTPARLKFIQSKTSEKNQIKKILNAFLLTWPEIEFTIKWDELDKEIYKPHTQEKIESRIKEVLHKKHPNIKLIHAQQSYDGSSCEIFLTQNSTRGNAHKSHFLFINGRFVQDIQIHKIILNSAKDLWPDGETGSYIAYLEIPSDEIDVNVHPNKTAIKIFRAPKAYSLISGTIKNEIKKNTANHSHFATNQSSNAQLPFEATSANLKEIHYSQYDFGEQNSLESYFDNLHSSDQIESVPSSKKEEKIKDYSDFSLYKINEEIFVLKKRELILDYLQKTLKKSDIQEKSIPLLVSRPISLSFKADEEYLESFNLIGFEIDALDKTTVVIRSFPAQLQGFPYIWLVETLLKNQSFELDIKSLKTLILTDINESFIRSTLAGYTIPLLLDLGLMRKLTQKDLEKIL